MHPRLAEEWEDIARVYAGACWRPMPERVEVPLQLTPGLFNATAITAGVLIPAGYPVTPLDQFLISAALRFADGSSLPANDAAGVGLGGWALVSFHFIDGAGNSTWRPTADPRRGDNLISYLSAVESFLDRRCN